ncbi:CybS-domain-containing protein [Thozetella sp. PMI_491]|nr:CybS-domain-containing protein [Thozetella sp. PMI_491]
MASIARSALLRQTALASRLSVASSRAGPSLTLLSKPLVNNAVRTTAFHTTSRRNLLPAPPQSIQGTVNDPQPLPPSHPSHGSYHWTFERLIAAGLIPLTVAPFAAGSLNPTVDAILAATILIHSHFGFQSIIIDYIPKSRYNGAHRLFMWGLNAATALVGLGLYEFETNDVGLTEAIKRIWKA